jgi:hypothetical protein
VRPRFRPELGAASDFLLAILPRLRGVNRVHQHCTAASRCRPRSPGTHRRRCSRRCVVDDVTRASPNSLHGPRPVRYNANGRGQNHGAIAFERYLRTNVPHFYRDRAGDWDAARLRKRKAASKTKHTCPACELNAWVKPDANLVRRLRGIDGGRAGEAGRRLKPACGSAGNITRSERQPAGHFNERGPDGSHPRRQGRNSSAANAWMQ